MNEKSWIAREALPFGIILARLAIILYFIHPWAMLPALLLLLFVLFFFRNPHRRIPVGEREALSPADGKVMAVSRVREDRFLDGQEMNKVTIFLSIFNVHFNRTPLTGTVRRIQYVEGKFFPAFKSHASQDNERNYLLLDTPRGPVLLAQITGFVARRIVCYAQEGQQLTQGQRFGLIKFGSCTEIYLPTEFNICVQAGDTVRGGRTVIGRYPS